jgi:hypothetical protein
VNVLGHPRAVRLQVDLFELQPAHAPSVRLVLRTPAGPADQAALPSSCATNRPAGSADR